MCEVKNGCEVSIVWVAQSLEEHLYVSPVECIALATVESETETPLRRSFRLTSETRKYGLERNQDLISFA